MGGPKELQVQRFCEAAYDSSTGLTYSAQKKQSIGDVEHPFSVNVEDFMRRKGYTYEAHYVCTIGNWRQATDEQQTSNDYHRNNVLRSTGIFFVWILMN